eukprot:6205033-Pleurochrysis_carterae.AAC.1
MCHARIDACHRSATFGLILAGRITRDCEFLLRAALSSTFVLLEDDIPAVHSHGRALVKGLERLYSNR